MRYLPGPVDPPKKLNKNYVEKADPKKVRKKNNVDKEGSPPARPPVRPPARAGCPGGGSPREEKKEGIYRDILYIATSHQTRSKTK